ncbi:major capsid protein [Acinetobacter phage vB_AbaP_Alexa]|nr:major capsid protein [Acinetobacter phage vB_AbaP_Alexa]
MRTKRLDLAMALTGAYFTREAGSGKALPDFNRDALKRTFHVERSSVNDDDRTVELSFSSEVEVERWFGIEVLSHEPGAMRTDRLENGGALLVNHDWDDQVGVIESVRIDADRKGRAVVRFGRSARADEIFQDVKDGIRKLVSVGYRILAAKITETRDNYDIYTITEWEPYEISIVSVPADATVGVGRSAEKAQDETSNPQTYNDPIHKQERNMKVKILRDASGNLVRAEVDDNDAILKVLEVLEEAGADVRSAQTAGRDTERNRVRALTEMGERYGDTALAMEYIKDGKSAEDLQRALLDKFNERSKKPIAEQTRNANIGMNEDELQRFSLARAIRAMLPGATQAERDAAKFEFECSEEAQKHYKREAKGLLIPMDVLNRAFNAGGAANTPVGATSGQNLVATDFRADAFIEMLRKRTTIMRLATTMGGLVGNVEIPKQTGAVAAYWLGEGQDATEGTPVIGQIGLTPHTVGAYTDITRRLLIQSTPDAERIVWNDLGNAIAQAIDVAGYYGSGTGNEPKGLKNYSGINAVDFAAANPTFAELVAMETAIATDNADVNSMAYVMNAAMRGHAKTTSKFAGGTDQGTIWEPGNTVNGYRTEITNQITAGDVFFGNFADFLIGLWGGLDITVDPYSLSKSGGLRIVAFQDVDFAVRREESFCYGSATVTP